MHILAHTGDALREYCVIVYARYGLDDALRGSDTHAAKVEVVVLNEKRPSGGYGMFYAATNCPTPQCSVGTGREIRDRIAAERNVSGIGDRIDVLIYPGCSAFCIEERTASRANCKTGSAGQRAKCAGVRMTSG